MLMVCKPVCVGVVLGIRYIERVYTKVSVIRLTTFKHSKTKKFKCTNEF